MEKVSGGRRLRGFIAIVAAVAAVGLIPIAPAGADGPCGQDYTSGTSCPVNSASTPSYQGKIVASNDTDFYVFYAVAGTHLTLTITDTESPTCSTAYTGSCGRVSVELFDSQANDVGGPGWSQPSSGITVPATWSIIIQSTGVYYAEVSGNLGSDQYNNPTDVPYALTVQASPNVQWPPARPPLNSTPAAAPPCTVPHYRGATLVSVEVRLTNHHCSVGTVHHAYSSSVRRGRVIRLSRKPGKQMADGAVVNIWVSRGRKRHHH